MTSTIERHGNRDAALVGEPLLAQISCPASYSGVVVATSRNEA